MGTFYKSNISVQILVILALFYSSSLNAMVLLGNLKHCTQNEIQLNVLFGRFHLQSDNVMIPVTAKGHFISHVHIQEIRVAELLIAGERIILLLNSSSDTLYVGMDCTDKANSLVFRGKLSLENQFINKQSFPNYHERFRKLKPNEKTNARLVDSIFHLEELHEKQLLKTLQNQMAKESYQFLEAEIEYYYLLLKIKAGLEVGYKSLKQYNLGWSNRNDSLFKSKSCAPDHKFGPYYNHYIGSWHAHLERKFQIGLGQDSSYWLKQFGTSSMDELMELLGKDKYNKPFYVLCEHELCDAAFEKALANKIYQSQEDGDFENLIFLFEKFIQKFPKSPYLERLALKMKSVEINMERINEQLPMVHFYEPELLFNSLDEIIQRKEFVGKVVLVDIWGTWCGPCREEFKHLPALKDKLKNQTVTYLYLAHEKTRNPLPHWQETAKYFNLSGYHYLLNEAVLNDFWRKVDPSSQLRSYPTYMIIGKDGKVQTPNAFPPSDGDRLYQQLLSALKE